MRLFLRLLAALGNLVLFCLLAPLALLVVAWEKIADWRRRTLIKHLYGGDAAAYERDRWKDGA